MIKENWRAVELPFTKLSTSFVSGAQDKSRIEISYFTQSDQLGELFAQIKYGPYSAGPPGHAHGGAQAAVLDELCGGIVWLQGYKALAVKLETEFQKMVPLGEPLIGRAKVRETDRRKIYTEAYLENQSGKILAQAKAVFVCLTEEQLKKLASQPKKPFP